MKRVIIFTAFALFCVSICFGQIKPAEKDQSNIEKFSAKSGVLIEKSFVDLGKVNTVKVQSLTLTDLISNAKISGIRFSFTAYTSYSSDEKIAFLDQDEVDGLIKSLTLLKNNVLTTTKENYTEVVFTSRTGFQLGAFFSDGKWTFFMQLEKYDSKSFVVLKSDDTDSLLTLLQNAKGKLGE
jgi:hypothetical protein